MDMKQFNFTVYPHRHHLPPPPLLPVVDLSGCLVCCVNSYYELSLSLSLSRFRLHCIAVLPYTTAYTSNQHPHELCLLHASYSLSLLLLQASAVCLSVCQPT
jgi:hypothetical protein